VGAPTLFGFCITLTVVTFTVQAGVLNGGRRAAANIIASLGAVHASCLFSSMISYRVFFHSLNSFSGPLMARATKLWHVSKTLQARNYMLLQKMHEEYGEFARTGWFHPLGSIEAQ
jgi:hypothetical protein